MESSQSFQFMSHLGQRGISELGTLYHASYMAPDTGQKSLQEITHVQDAIFPFRESFFFLKLGDM